MNFREALGLLLIVASLVLVPAAWAFSNLLWALAFVLLVVGAGLFYTERIIKKEEQLEKESGGSCQGGRAMPTDIHNYTGWRSGGRSSSFESDSSGGADAD